MSAYRPKDGDRVRVTVEGEVRGASKVYTDFVVGTNRFADDDSHVVSIEKLEPPVVTFKPGDVVRGRVSGRVYTLARGGRVDHLSWEWRPLESDEHEQFNSGLFELVD